MFPACKIVTQRLVILDKWQLMPDLFYLTSIFYDFTAQNSIHKNLRRGLLINNVNGMTGNQGRRFSSQATLSQAYGSEAFL